LRRLYNALTVPHRGYLPRADYYYAPPASPAPPALARTAAAWDRINTPHSRFAYSRLPPPLLPLMPHCQDYRLFIFCSGSTYLLGHTILTLPAGTPPALLQQRRFTYAFTCLAFRRDYAPLHATYRAFSAL